MIKVGPYGCSEGESWDEMGKKRIARIYIHHGERINSIQTAYVEGTSMILSEKHGGGGALFNTIVLDCPNEFLVAITGRYNAYRMSSITFVTNQRTHGPFGAGEKENIDTYFSITFEGDFFGFHGYSNSTHLRGIGVYVKPPTAVPSTSSAIVAKTEPAC